MNQIYVTQQGDELDHICFRFYGYSRGSTEQVLALEENRELALELPILREGLRVVLPPIAPPPPEPRLSLWS
jgi:phage tail protein X